MVGLNGQLKGAEKMRMSDWANVKAPGKTQHHLDISHKATAPCAFAYNYARIRRLVRLGGCR